ncbi:MAG TPA: thioredoxin-dependent thiol peroxidase [Lentisphaeria bacterium]|jgi:peroxiredoxin Q/BCP|nr:thioredoxin-dependent thiol peroxidase [Lentisphaeria bacterium]
MALQPGDKAPQFSGKTQTGETVSLDQFRGKTVILYFYPKDDTPGCTKEACSLRDNFEVLTERGIVVVGVSPDGVESHQKFVAKYDLPFQLLADEDRTVIAAYGIWGEKMNYGKRSMGILRHTYVIGPDGEIRKIFKQVKTAEHAQQILKFLDS